MSVASELEKLAGLLREGLVTREEFDEQKRVLMSNATNASNPSLGADSSPSIGKSLGAYNILGMVGRGGMGVVYRARHRSSQIASRQGGDVALKVLHAQYSQDPTFQERFEREATLGLKLNHPGIVKVHDLIVDGDSLALTMELVKGQELSDLIGKVRGPIPWREALAMFDGLLDAVSHAHSEGVIHRDLKPENVMVCEGGGLKVLDFGIARDESSGKTKTGTGMGTVDYMAPEQYTDASKVDARADIYALGMTLYEMVAGRLPWDAAATEFEVLNTKAAGNIPPPTQFYPDIPPELVAVIAQAMDVDLGRRCQSADAFRRALQAVAEGGDAPVTVDRVRSTKDVAQESEPPKKPWFWLGLVGVIFVGFVGFNTYSVSGFTGPNSIGMEFAVIPAGTYKIGCTAGQSDCDDYEKPAHNVKLTRSFSMMTTEVTQGQYRAVTGENPSQFSQCGENCPVEKVNWYDAAKFANALSKSEGLSACYRINGENVKLSNGLDCEGYRLPTEAEWEVAARGGADTLYAGSDDLRSVGWYISNSGGNTHPVGQKHANGYGLYDMSGNVREWTWDRYDSDYYTSSTMTDPQGPSNGSNRVARGGSWNSRAEDTRVSANTAVLPSDSVEHIFNVSYGRGRNLQEIKEHYGIVTMMLGPDVAKKLQIEQDSTGKYALVYKRYGDLESTQKVAKHHARLLKNKGVDASFIQEKNSLGFRLARTNP
jgi:serine/threonine protein kinase